METLGLMDRSLYDIGENDMLDVWGSDFATVRSKGSPRLPPGAAS